MPNTEEEIIDPDPLLDTGKAAREALRIAQKVLRIAEAIDKRTALVQDMSTDVKAIKQMEEADHQQRDTITTAIKRGVLQTLKGLKWID